jgi:hypothetical protein
MLTEKTIAAMLADITYAQDLLAKPWQTPGGALWAPGHAQAWSRLEYVRAKLAQALTEGADHVN